MEILVLKNTKNKVKNATENVSKTQSSRRVCELKNGSFEIVQER